VRLAACRALVAFGDERAVDPLIDRLETEGGRLQREVLKALRAVSREGFGLEARTWRAWWKAQQPHGLPKAPDAAPPPNPEDERYAKPRKRPGDPLEEEPVYYGRRIWSQAVVFVLDLSLSMQTTIEVPKDAQEKLGVLAAGPRIDVARSAAHAALEKLDPRTRFNVVFFSTDVRPWKDDLVPAATHKDAAVNAVDAAGLEGETNIFGALRAAFGLHDRPTLAGELDRVPDTVFFLTDGTPTRGEITDTETILSWVQDVNRTAKVELNVVAMGSLGLDLPFLQRLATENGGFFVHVPDRK
jgi:Mg-chelatase subunit ChlD